MNNYVSFKVDNKSAFKPFDCGDKDLNEFLLEKSKHYNEELLATTIVFENDVKTIAYYSIFNDSLDIEQFSFSSKNAIKRLIRKLVPHPKRHLKSFPAIKIRRLAVCKNLQKSGLGRKIMDNVINYDIEQNEKCACKFIIVDAYKKSLRYYENMGFEYLSDNDLNENTRQIYLDISPYVNAKREQKYIVDKKIQ